MRTSEASLSSQMHGVRLLDVAASKRLLGAPGGKEIRDVAAELRSSLAGEPAGEALSSAGTLLACAALGGRIDSFAAESATPPMALVLGAQPDPFAIWCAGRGCRVTTLDPEPATPFARIQAKRSHVLRAQWARLPFADASCDVLAAGPGWIRQPAGADRLALWEAARVLRPGGHFLAVLPVAPPDASLAVTRLPRSPYSGQELECFLRAGSQAFATGKRLAIEAPTWDEVRAFWKDLLGDSQDPLLPEPWLPLVVCWKRNDAPATVALEARMEATEDARASLDAALRHWETRLRIPVVPRLFAEEVASQLGILVECEQLRADRAELDRRYEHACENAESLQKKAERLQRALTKVRKQNLIGRLINQFQPRLGDFFQYRARQMTIPGRYRHTPAPAAPPLVSVVTPSYQQGGFLEETLRSVLEQGYPRLEYIVQDGGSTDRTVDILDRFRPKLTFAESVRDRGQADALNRGFARTSGEIMGWVNSDDLYLPGALNYVAAWFEGHPEVDVVYGHRVVINTQGHEVGRWVLPPHPEDDTLLWADYIPQETLFWRRRIWERTGGRICEDFDFAVDWELLLRFREAGAKMVRLPRFLGAFRIHALQKTTAGIEVAGRREMDALRKRYLGTVPPGYTIARRLRGFMARHVACQLMYRMGLFKY